MNERTEEYLYQGVIFNLIVSGYPITEEDCAEIKKSFNSPEDFKKAIDRIIEKYDKGEEE